MYCFSEICRICLEDYKSKYIHLNSFDVDNIKIRNKLNFCIPEIISNQSQLPENVCESCQLFLQKMYKFKHMCIENTNILNDYICKLAGDKNSNNHHKLDLSVTLNKTLEDKDVNTIATDNNKKMNIMKTETKDDENTGETKFSISLNQWDLFETKFTCRCVKDYNSFLEGTSHLCQNCEGDLHGFQLSKIKLGNAENRYNNLCKENKFDDDSNQSVDFEKVNNASCEEGFSYNDVMLCKVHVNNVKKQIDVLQNDTDDNIEEFDTSVENNDTSSGKIKISKNKRDKTFMCPICSKCYTTRYYLHLHYAQHKDSIFYYCEECHRKFVSEDELDKHKQIHLKKTNINKQSTPNKSPFNHSITITNDLNTNKSDLNDSDDSLVCATCDKSFINKSNLAIHLLTHVGKQEYKCKDCGEEFFRKENLISHRTIHKSNRKYQCEQCDKTYNHKSNLRRHERCHGGAYLCSICNQTFSLKQVLVDHIYDVHSKVTNEHSCPYCNETFTHEDKLKIHIIDTHKLKKTRSKSNTFSDDIIKIEKSEIKSEKKLKKKQSSVRKIFTCDICNKQFYRMGNFQEHVKSHKTVYGKDGKMKKNFLVKDNGSTGQYCSICKRIYSVNTNMKKHLQSHSHGKLRNCSFCNKKFTNRFLLREHLRLHAEKFSYKCDICGKAYLTKQTKLRHMAITHKSTI